MTTICPKCGTTLVPNATYCSACGVNVATLKGATYAKQYTVASDDLSKKVRELLRDATVTRVIVKDEKGTTLLEMPGTVGTTGAPLAPWLAALGVIAAFSAHPTLVVVKNVPVPMAV